MATLFIVNQWLYLELKNHSIGCFRQVYFDKTTHGFEVKMDFQYLGLIYYTAWNYVGDIEFSQKKDYCSCPKRMVHFQVPNTPNSRC